jgi:hypothetical protein
MQFSQICDLVEVDAGYGPIDTLAFPGTWLNSNPDSNGISHLVISEQNGNLLLTVHAVGPKGLIEWDATGISVFAATPSSRSGSGFTSIHDFGFAQTRLQGMIMKGLLVLAQFHSFKDDSKRVDYFVREYFALARVETEAEQVERNRS